MPLISKDGSRRVREVRGALGAHILKENVILQSNLIHLFYIEAYLLLKTLVQTSSLFIVSQVLTPQNIVQKNNSLKINNIGNLTATTGEVVNKTNTKSNQCNVTRNGIAYHQ